MLYCSKKLDYKIGNVISNVIGNVIGNTTEDIDVLPNNTVAGSLCDIMA